MSSHAAPVCSDWSVNVQSDAYLRQLENEGNVPAGMAMCSEGLCVKCHLLEMYRSGGLNTCHCRARLSSAQSKDGLGSKVFINVTHCSEIEEASMEAATDPVTGKKGQRWKMPFTLSPKSEIVEDHAGDKVLLLCVSITALKSLCLQATAFDVAVNSNTFNNQVVRNKRFCDMVCLPIYLEPSMLSH